MAVMTGAQWADEVLLPHKPSATNDPRDGQRPMHRENALMMRYIEHSPYVLLGSIVIDCDHVDTALRAFERPKDHPDPNWVAQSPSGRGHIGWWLRSPVCKSDSARLKPLRYAQRVEAGLRIAVGGDPAFEPHHPEHRCFHVGFLHRYGSHNGRFVALEGFQLRLIDDDPAFLGLDLPGPLIGGAGDLADQDCDDQEQQLDQPWR